MGKVVSVPPLFVCRIFLVPLNVVSPHFGVCRFVLLLLSLISVIVIVKLSVPFRVRVVKLSKPTLPLGMRGVQFLLIVSPRGKLVRSLSQLLHIWWQRFSFLLVFSVRRPVSNDVLKFSSCCCNVLLFSADFNDAPISIAVLRHENVGLRLLANLP